MARPLRLEFPGALYHVTTRGNGGQDVFGSDEDRGSFLDILHGAVKRFEWVCHAYCLMGDHYHLVLETPEANLSAGMRQVNGIYTQYFNRRQARGGHLFQGRYKALLVERDPYLLEVVRHVLLNPVRAGLVQRPEEWPWSSYGGMCGLSAPHSCLTTKMVLGMLADDPQEALRRLQAFMADGVEAPSPWGKVTGQVLLGSREYVDGLSHYLRDFRQQSEIPRSQRLLNRPPLEVLLADRRRKERDLAIAESVGRWGYTQKNVADFLGLHYSTISRILAVAKTPPAAVLSSATEEPREAGPPPSSSPTPMPPHMTSPEPAPAASPLPKSTTRRGKSVDQGGQLSLFTPIEDVTGKP
jgi:REP element-mobilizing transposase RayT